MAMIEFLNIEATLLNHIISSNLMHVDRYHIHDMLVIRMFAMTEWQ